MSKGKITKRMVDQTKPEDKDFYLWDSDLSGFGLKVTPKGKRTYLVQYRLGGRKARTRRLTIGQHGVLTPDQARIQAKKILGEVAAGLDPAEQKDRHRTEKALGVIFERFFAEHVEAKLKTSTIAEYKRLFRLYITNDLKHRLVSEIKRKDISDLHHSMKHMPYQANRTIALLSKFFTWCEKNGIRSDGSNPCRYIEKYPEKKHDRFLRPEELKRLGVALREAEEQKTATPWTIAAIRLLLLTGSRLNEILTLHWEYVNLDSQHIRLPDSKTGQKSIYLSSQAIAVLTEIPRLENNPYVICGEKPGAHLVNLQKPWRRIRKAADLEDVRIHDLRHTFASIGAIGGVSLPIIGGLVGHSQPQTTARYAHLSADPLRAANDMIGESIAGALDLNILK